jgi:REP element-mobilizing transposase RayT
MLACMLTWTTYGTWLQGDRRGYVKNAEVLPADDDRYRANQIQMKCQVVRLSMKQRSIVQKTIVEVASKAGHNIFALAVATNHVHLLIEPAGQPFGRLVSRYKNTTRRAIEAEGFVGQLWTKGFDKRYCNSQEDMGQQDSIHCSA